MKLSDPIKRLLLAGLGAAAVTTEKSKEIVDTLVKKGELTVEEGKTLNQELKVRAQEKAQEKRTDRMADKVSRLTAEERDELRKMLDIADEEEAAAAALLEEPEAEDAEEEAEE